MRSGCGHVAWALVGMLAILPLGPFACSDDTKTQGGATGGTGGGGTTRAWTCLDSDVSCECRAHGVGDRVLSSGSVPRCGAYSCCFITGTGPQAICDCMQSTACATEVASRRGAVQSSECPPSAEQPPVKCAQQAENCRSSYLAAQGLEGCCDGLACKVDASGVPLCQPATAAEAMRAKACASTAYHGSGSVALAAPIQTATGPLDINTVYVGLEKSTAIGPGGCIVSMSVDLGTCSFTMSASPDAPGTYNVTPDLTGLCDFIGLGQAITGTASFDGVACEGGIGGYCYAGTIELRLTSVNATQQPVLTGAPIQVDATFCPVTTSKVSTCAG